MATIGNDANGFRRILFVAGDGRRKTIRLGKMDRKTAENCRTHVEKIIGANMGGGSLPETTYKWLADLPETLHARLAAAGLVKPRNSSTAALGDFIDEYLAQRTDLKAGTLIVMKQARRWLVTFLGEAKPLADVTPGDADAYRAHLLGAKRSKATVVKWCRYARHYFQVACRRRLIPENPFGHIKGSIRGNPARRVFVPGDDVRKVIDAAADPQWKLLIALGRWGGLRIPSEALALTWGDVDFARQRFTVRASKTEHHADGGIRIVPMFPELAEHFQAVFDAAPEGSTHVITRYRSAGQNLRTQLTRYITSAGLKPWPKPWQNMRASRATDLADQFPSHVCAAWLGHPEAVANEFYRQVTDDHFAKAQSAAQNPAQYPAEPGGMGPKTDSHDAQKIPVLQGDSAPYATVQNGGLGDEGFEPTTSSV